MMKEKQIKRFAYAVLAILSALVFWCYWIMRDSEIYEPHYFFSPSTAMVISCCCSLLAVIAICGVAFIVAKAFYLGITEANSKKKAQSKNKN